MILNIHSEASYLSESRARSRAAGHYFLGSISDKNKPIKLNGAVHSLGSGLIVGKPVGMRKVVGNSEKLL